MYSNRFSFAYNAAEEKRIKEACERAAQIAFINRKPP